MIPNRIILKEEHVTILVVDDEEMIRLLIQRTLAKFSTYKIVCAGNGKEALELYRQFKPICVFSDIIMPVMDGLTFLEKLKELDPGANVVLLSGYGTEEMIIRALRAGALNYLKKPVNIEELILITKKIVTLYHEEQQKKITVVPVKQERKLLSVDNNIYEISGVINQLLQCASNICKPASLTGLKTGLYEMIINAIEHGNLDITFEEKSHALDQDAYNDLLEARFNNPDYQKRKVIIDYEMDDEKLRFTIRDQGKGFDWESVTYEDDMETLSRPHGRGILMTRFYFDEVKFNESGNEVTLIKYADQD
ncbi:MAG: response regulator [Candidatus Zhuqueibacterota bacterium]